MVSADFPGGNIVVDSIDGGVIRLRPDLRDTSTDWFYWCFAIRGAEGHTLTFVFEAKYLGVRGPGVSMDGGVTWNWMGAEAVRNGAFSYAFPSDVSDVRFSVAMSYVRVDWDRFLTTQKSDFWQVETLARTATGRDVPVLRMESPLPAPICVAFTARHHACEMMASYVLEGVIEEVLAEDGAGRWLRQHVSFLIVPLMDADGVEQGDQGKNRRPHDHNRDYSDTPIYSEVCAWKERVSAWSRESRAFLSFDLHCPALCGPVHESVFFLEPEDRTAAARLDALSDCILRAQRGDGLLRLPMKLPYGCGFNATPRSEKRTFSSWSEGLPNAWLNTSLEVAYANALGAPVTAESAHKLGRAFARGLGEWLEGCAFPPSAS